MLLMTDENEISFRNYEVTKHKTLDEVTNFYEYLRYSQLKSHFYNFPTLIESASAVLIYVSGGG